MPTDRSSNIVLPLIDVHEFVHDLRNSLYAMRMGLDVLSRVREDVTRFDQLCQMLEQEQQRAVQRLEAFAQTAPRSLE